MSDNMNSLTVNHRNILISFLRIHPINAASLIVDARSTQKIEYFMNKIFQKLTKGTEKGYYFDQFIEHNTKLAVSSICKIAEEATKIPLSIFTDLFHNRFKKKNYLESTLELLQQVYIKIAERSKTYKIWVGDQHKYCLHCSRCNRAITNPDVIDGILGIAPVAILWHLNLDDGGKILSPFVFPTEKYQHDSCSIFEGKMEDHGDTHPSPFNQCNASTNQGMLRFCEATKVDFESSKLSRKKRTIRMTVP